MAVHFDHTIIPSTDPENSARFLTELLRLPEPTTWGPFTTVTLDDGCTLQYANPGIAFPGQHFAFLVDDAGFDAAYQQIIAAGHTFWADPRKELAGQVNTNHGGRGLYFDDPDGHHLEILTRRYGSDLVTG